jgi:hypothetical protein
MIIPFSFVNLFMWFCCLILTCPPQIHSLYLSSCGDWQIRQWQELRRWYYMDHGFNSSCHSSHLRFWCGWTFSPNSIHHLVGISSMCSFSPRGFWLLLVTDVSYRLSLGSFWTIFKCSSVKIMICVSALSCQVS